MDFRFTFILFLLSLLDRTSQLIFVYLSDVIVILKFRR